VVVKERSGGLCRLAAAGAWVPPPPAAAGMAVVLAVAAVFLSTRTVEFHLSRAYRKLGVSSRTELTRRLATAGTIAS
jgi:hypothetical protein